MEENGTQDDVTGADENAEGTIPAPTPEFVKEEASDFDPQDETEEETFPARDPQSSWAGPADPRDR